MSRAVAIAMFLAKDSSRIFFKIASPFERYAHEIEIFVHSSLDIIDDKSAKTNESYLGQLYGNQTYKSFGYVTNSGVQMIAVVEIANLAKDQETRALFKKLHSAYCAVLANPFYEYGTEIVSNKYLQATTDAVMAE